MKKYFYGILILLINLAILWYCYQQRKITESLVDDAGYKSIVCYDYFNAMKLNGLILDSTANFSDINDSIFTLRQVQKTKRTLFLRYSFIHCNACVDTVIKLLNQLSLEVGTNKVAILAQYRSKRDYKNFMRINTVKPALYNYQDSLCKADKLDVPYFFVLEDDLVMNNFFIPRKETPNITRLYLESIKNLFIN